MPHRSVVVIDKVRKDGPVFASDYTDCDHGMDGFRKVMFRLQAGAPRLQIGAAYSLEYESEDLQKPLVQKSRSGKTTTYYTQMFYLCGVEGAEREGSLRKEGGESGAPSSLSPRTAHLNAIGGPI